MGDTALPGPIDDLALTRMRDRIRELEQEIRGHEQVLDRSKVVRDELVDLVGQIERERVDREKKLSRRSRGAIDIASARRAAREEPANPEVPTRCPASVFASPTGDPDVIEVEIPDDPEAA